MLEDLGLRVIEEIPTRLVAATDETWVQDFRVLGPDGKPLDLDALGDARGRAARGRPARRRRVRQAQPARDHRRAWTGARSAILRAYRKYRQRVGSRFTESYQNDVLVANSARRPPKLVRYFELRFDPELETDEAAETALREEILADLDEVASLDHDRILRNQLTLIEATLRTNAYNGAGAARCAFKLRSADVPAMPQPAPLFEIYVYSADVEGIHLRGGRDRPRRPALVGPPGLPHRGLRADARPADQERRDRPGGREGRLLPQAPARRPERAARRRSSASTSPTSARCSTSPTTSSTARSSTRPDVRVRDGDDTYLVVAADKGTATFSDTANAVAQEYGFWLDDAFASGGSAGYDHKKLGITARGRVGVGQAPLPRARARPGRPTSSPSSASATCRATCSATGCCSRDHIRLVAAYDHRHIFIDPDPDAATSASPSASGCSTSPARPGTTTTAR